MGLIINILVAVASAILWLVKKFFPMLIKKYGLGSVKFAIQKTISALLVATTVAFYTSVVVFISQTFTVFRNFIELLNDPSSSPFGGSGSSMIPCILSLLDASGISAGFNAAFSFGISVLIFLFLHKLYQVSVRALKILSDELQKAFMAGTL